MRISLCMIVKNEERVLARCLDSICDLMDEIVIVDTGSTDRTKEIAYRYTQKVYDFVWVQDFAAARNFAFDKATCDYIYSADADEVLDQENHERFRILKDSLLPEIEIVQMYYGNQLENGTVYNFDKELRPKLFKRQRSFVWIDPVHEAVRLLPVVYDSDIVITHMPEQNHKDRDIAIFERLVRNGQQLSERLEEFYAKELMISGTKEQLICAGNYFRTVADAQETSMDRQKKAWCILVKGYLESGDVPAMYRYAMKDVASEASSEVCCVLGDYYRERTEYEEAVLWYYNAAYEQESILNIRYQRELPLQGLIACYAALGMAEQEQHYRSELESVDAE